MREGATSPRLVDGKSYVKTTNYRNILFQRVDWTGQKFSNIHFAFCRFEDVLLTDVTFHGCVFHACQFDAATFERVEFFLGRMRSTSFTHSDLRGTVFRAAYSDGHGNVDTQPMLEECTFQDVGLEDAGFYCYGYRVHFDDVTMQDTMIGRRGKPNAMSGDVQNLTLDFDPAVMAQVRRR